MTVPIMQLDAELEWLGQIADELERQGAICPVSRRTLIGWLTGGQEALTDRKD